MACLIAGCSTSSGGSSPADAAGDTTAPTVSSFTPANGSGSVADGSALTITFSKAMAPASISSTTFTLTSAPGAVAAAGAVTLNAAGTVATFTPTAHMTNDTVYTATLTTGAKDVAGNPLAANSTWTFTTQLGPATVILGTAGNYAIFAETGITTTGTTAVVGDVGLNSTNGNLTGFEPLTFDPVNLQFATSGLVTGKIWTTSMSYGTPAVLGIAKDDMVAAYDEASTRPSAIDGPGSAGAIGGLTIVPGLYKWSMPVEIGSDVTLNGGLNDVWIFQITGTLTQDAATHVLLTGQAQAKNVFWVVSTAATLLAGAEFQGVLLTKTGISLDSGAKATGSLLAQTAVTMIANSVTKN
jgi:hypothetical protein